MRVKENYGRDAPSRIPAVRLELSEMRGRRFMAEIQLEKTALGLELGSTRIKAVLIGPEHAVLASGAHDWENRLEHGYWTYALDDVWAGVQDAFARLARQVQERYGTPLHTVGADPIPVKGLDGLLGSVGLTFFAFAGYGMMANTAGNLKNPSRTLPRAIFMAIGLVLALYLILSYVVLSNVPATSLESHTETAVAQAAYPVLGMWGFMAVSVAALIATASAINATMFSMLDISRALAHNGQLGAIFKQPFWGHGTEGFFYLLLGILVMTNAFNLVAIANLAGACFLISYLAVFVAHWRLRKETQGNVLLIILGFLLMLFILGAFFYQMFFSQPYLIPLIVLFVAACFILEFLIRRKIAKNVPRVS